jgi:hypothetical protein
MPGEPGDPAPGLRFLGEEERAGLEAGNIGALVPRLAAQEVS